MVGLSCNEITGGHFVTFDCSVLFELGMKSGF